MITLNNDGDEFIIRFLLSLLLHTQRFKTDVMNFITLTGYTKTSRQQFL